MPKKRISISMDSEILGWIDRQIQEHRFANRDLLIERCLVECKKRCDERRSSPPPSNAYARTALDSAKISPYRKTQKGPQKPPGQSPQSSPTKVAIPELRLGLPPESPSKGVPEQSSQTRSSFANKARAINGRDSPSAPSRKPPEPPWLKKKTKEAQKERVYEREYN